MLGDDRMDDDMTDIMTEYGTFRITEPEVIDELVKFIEVEVVNLLDLVSDLNPGAYEDHDVEPAPPSITTDV